MSGMFFKTQHKHCISLDIFIWLLRTDYMSKLIHYFVLILWIFAVLHYRLYNIK